MPEGDDDCVGELDVQDDGPERLLGDGLAEARQVADLGQLRQCGLSIPRTGEPLQHLERWRELELASV